MRAGGYDFPVEASVARSSFLLIALVLAACARGCGDARDGPGVIIRLVANEGAPRPEYVRVEWKVPDSPAEMEFRLPRQGVLTSTGPDLGSIHVSLAAEKTGPREIVARGIRDGDVVSTAATRIAWGVRDVTLRLTASTPDAGAAPGGAIVPRPPLDAGARDGPRAPSLDAAPGDGAPGAGASGDVPPAVDAAPRGDGAPAAGVDAEAPAADAAAPPGALDAGPRPPGREALLLHWRFDEATGTRAADSSGNGFHGTHVGGTGVPQASAEAAPVGFPNARSLAFVMADRHAVQLAPIPAVMKQPNDITMCAWFRAVAVDLDGPYSDIVSAGDVLVLRLRRAHIEPVKSVPTGWVGCPTPAPTALDGRWHHFCGSFGARTGITLFLDGAQLGSCPTTTPINWSRGSDLYAGRHANGSWADFGGNIDDIRIYRRVLVPDEIRALAAGAD
jgi:hypothetical protein